MKDTELVRKRLSEAYKNSGCTYEDLEAKTGIGHSVINRYITGVTKKVPFDDLIDICYAMGVDPRVILGWVDEPEAPDKDELVEVSEQLSASGKAELTNYGRYLLDREEKR